MNVGMIAASLLMLALLYLHCSALVALVKARELTPTQKIFQACLVCLVPVFGPLFVLHLLRESDPDRTLRTNGPGTDLAVERYDTPADRDTASHRFGDMGHHGAHEPSAGDGHAD
ncbi:MAG: hypothetical protein HY749_00090 [Gammaproteobacteria bacterium]|nr:hypothetical protein [Gammaproteobacteria bacterium]